MVRDIIYHAADRVSGYADEAGAGEGAGATLNLPLAPGSGDAAFIAAVERLAQGPIERRVSTSVRRAGLAARVALAGAPDNTWHSTDSSTDARVLLLDAIVLLNDPAWGFSDATTGKGLKAKGIEAHWVAADASDPAGVKKVVDETMQRLGRIDILVNNAGITGGNATTWELQPEVWRRVVEVTSSRPT